MAEPADIASSATGYYVNVDDYYDELHHTTWARRTAGMLAGASLGAIYGGVIGTAAAFVPYVLGAIGVAGAAPAFAAGLPALAAIGTSAALFSALAAGTGMFVTADVASNAASSAVGLEEERQQSQILGNTIQPVKTMNGETKAPPFFSWKIAAVGAALFAAFGALMAFNPATAFTIFKETPFGLLPETVTTASVAASAVVFGMFGSLLGMRNSALTNSLCNFYYKVVTGHVFNKEPQQDMSAPAPQVVAEPSINEPEPQKSFTQGRERFSLQDIIEKSNKGSPDQDAVLTR